MTPQPTQPKKRTYTGPISTTDAIIEYRQGPTQGLVLIKRRNPPHGLALPGGFHELGLSLEENARKEVLEETGLAFLIGNVGRPWTYSEPRRDPRGHMIAHVFYGRGVGDLIAGDDATSANVYPIERVEELLREHTARTPVFAFDHARILTDYLRWRRTWEDDEGDDE